MRMEVERERERVGRGRSKGRSTGRSRGRGKGKGKGKGKEKGRWSPPMLSAMTRGQTAVRSDANSSVEVCEIREIQGTRTGQQDTRTTGEQDNKTQDTGHTAHKTELSGYIAESGPRGRPEGRVGAGFWWWRHWWVWQTGRLADWRTGGLTVWQPGKWQWMMAANAIQSL